jgi:hypothetical protein
MAEIGERVIALVVEETRTKPTRVQLASRLAEDIGMDGDDAVEFFEKFGEAFHVDLTPLGDRWDQHFSGEGGPSPGWLVVIGASIAVAAILHELVKWVPMWASTIALVALSCWIYSRFFHQAKLPVTVQDLVDAAVSGKWVKEYEERPVVSKPPRLT